jgi:tRNA(Ile)-lysidine synthase
VTADPEVALRAFLARIAPGSSVAIAVSGGGDSVALLHLAARVAPALGLGLAAVTVDHGLRPEAATEARAVSGWAATRGIGHTTLSWVERPARGNLQAAARAARYRLIGSWAREQGHGVVLLAHTADDVAETFLMRIGRRSGAEGLAAMAEEFRFEGLRWLRPFATVRRSALRAVLTEAAQGWIEDPSNADARFARARIRRALPALEAAGVGIADVLASARHLAAARAALRAHAAEAAARVVAPDRGDLVVDCAGFAALPAETRLRILRAALRWISGAPHPARAAEIARLDAALIAGRAATLAGVRMAPSGAGRARLGREPRAVGEIVTPAADLWDGRWRLEGPAPPAEARLRVTGAAGLAQAPCWRALGLPRPSQLAAPALWSADGTLLAAPLAGLAGHGGWRVSATGWPSGLVDDVWRIEDDGDIPI